jgi:hypothetical protein
MDPPLEAGLHNLSGLSVESIGYIQQQQQQQQQQEHM